MCVCVCVCVCAHSGGRGAQTKLLCITNEKNYQWFGGESYEINDSRGLRKDTSVETICVYGNILPGLP